MKKRVAVIGGRPAPIFGAKELGIDVVLVHEIGQYEESIIEHCENILHADITDGKAIVQALEPLHRERPFDRILTTTEFAGESTGFAVDYFGLPGVSEATAKLLKDKTAMRRLLSHLPDLCPVKFADVNSPNDALSFVKRHGRSVLKPADGVASLHIHECHDEQSVLEGLRNLNNAEVQSIIIEEFLNGPVVSVDSFSYDSRHLTIGYSEYRMNNKFVEWEVSTPSSVAVPWLRELREMTMGLLDAVGLTEGPSHTEFILTAGGPRILESHARLAGSGAPELVRRAFGVDLDRMFLTVPLGLEELPSSEPDPIAGAAVQFLVPSPGEVVDLAVDVSNDVVCKETTPGEVLPVFLPFLRELRSAKKAIVLQKHVGEIIPPLDTVADCVSGYALATAKDRVSAVNMVDSLVSGVHFTVREMK